jgi:exodeoxyribonuclease VII small subunit
MKKTEQKRTFEASLSSLEQIVKELERGDLPLEESLKLFEEGVKLSRECQDRLNQAERRIEMLMRDGDGRPVISGLPGSESSLAEDMDEESDDESVF